MPKINGPLIKEMLSLITEVIENVIDPILFTKKELKHLCKLKKKREKCLIN